MAVKFVKIQGAVIKGGGQTKTVIHQHFLSGVVPGEHAPHLGQSHVGFVHEQQKIVGKIIQQSKGRAARFPAGKHSGIVLNALAEADLGKQLHIVPGALLNALGLNELVIGLEKATRASSSL